MFINVMNVILMSNIGISIFKEKRNTNKYQNFGKFQRCPFNVGKPFFRWGYVILSQNKSDLVVF